MFFLLFSGVVILLGFRLILCGAYSYCDDNVILIKTVMFFNKKVSGKASFSYFYMNRGLFN